MLRSSVFGAGGLALILASTPPARSQDFDPAGRRHRQAPPQATPNGASKPPARAQKANASEGKTEPAAAALIARYTAIVLAQPASPFPLQRLTQLYRERDGNLTELVRDFEKRATDAGPEQWNARVALAAIYQQDGRMDDAAKAYESAILQRPKDPAPLLSLARLAKDRGDLPAAQKTFEQALPLLGPQDREPTLRALIAVLLDLKDFEGAKARSRELLRQSQNSIF